MDRLSIFFILALVVGVSACEQIVLGDEPSVNSVALFEQLWTDYDQHSSLIHPKQINWDSVYQVYRPQVTPLTTEAELWQIFADMIEVFDDEHTFIFNPDADESYVSGASGIERAIASFSKELIRSSYLEYVKEIDIAPDFSYGKFKERDIGYIYIGDTDGGNPAASIDKVLSEIGGHGAIIFDVRNNGGGNDFFAEQICNAFAEADHFVWSIQTRNGPGYNDFDEKTLIHLHNDNNKQYTNPVIVLTDRFSVSGAEHIAQRLLVNSKMTHIGDTTAGALSSTGNRRFLPNGWQFQYPIQLVLDVNNRSLEGIGLIPEIPIENTPEDIEQGHDLTLQRALDYVRDRYGI